MNVNLSCADSDVSRGTVRIHGDNRFIIQTTPLNGF